MFKNQWGYSVTIWTDPWNCWNADWIEDEASKHGPFIDFYMQTLKVLLWVKLWNLKGNRLISLKDFGYAGSLLHGHPLKGACGALKKVPPPFESSVPFRCHPLNYFDSFKVKHFFRSALSLQGGGGHFLESAPWHFCRGEVGLSRILQLVLTNGSNCY